MNKIITLNSLVRIEVKEIMYGLHNYSAYCTVDNRMLTCGTAVIKNEEQLDKLIDDTFDSVIDFATKALKYGSGYCLA